MRGCRRNDRRETAAGDAGRQRWRASEAAVRASETPSPPPVNARLAAVCTEDVWHGIHVRRPTMSSHRSGRPSHAHQNHTARPVNRGGYDVNECQSRSRAFRRRWALTGGVKVYLSVGGVTLWEGEPLFEYTYATKQKKNVVTFLDFEKKTLKTWKSREVLETKSVFVL